MHGSSLLWAEFVWADFVMGRIRNGPILLWAEMSSYPLVVQVQFCMPIGFYLKFFMTSCQTAMN